MYKKSPFILGLLTILVAVGIVVAQHSSQRNTATPVTPVPATTTSYTMSDVATHKTRSDCWTAVNSSVYNVTSWISAHPGGAQLIIGMCGVDASSAFDAQHGGQKRPESELVSFKIGTLK